MKTFRGMDVWTQVFLTSALIGGEWLALLYVMSLPLYPRERAPRYQLDRRLHGPQSRSGQHEK
jgi:hypothetical protein